MRQDYQDFITNNLEQVPGWLNGITAAATFVMLEEQEKSTSEGYLVEIGTYAGKYLSVLARYAVDTDTSVVSLDPFIHFTPQQVEKYVCTSLGGRSTNLKLRMHKCFSQTLTPDAIHKIAQSGRECASGSVRLFHIDGSHDYEDVLWDITVAAPMLTHDGILVIDDIFSPTDIGVTEAFFRYQFTSPYPLSPIAYVANKLFLSRHGFADRYKAALELFLTTDNHFPASEGFKKRLATQGAGRRIVETQLCGRPYLIA